MANDFSGDANCKALWRLESGALTADSKGDNILTNVGVDEDQVNFKEGACSGLFIRANSDRMLINDADSDAGFPLRNDAANTNFSFASWFKLTAGGAVQYIISKSGGPGSYQMIIYVDFENKLNLVISDDGTDLSYYTHASTLAADTFYHFGITHNDADNAYRIRIWDDTAQAILGDDKTGTTVTPFLCDAPFYLGNTSSDYTLGGNEDEVVAFNDVLTIIEIDQIRAGTYGGTTIVEPDTLALVLTQHAPVVSIDCTVTPDAFALALHTPAIDVGTGNDFTEDANCKALWNLESGALTTDSQCANTLVNNGVTADTADYKQGLASGDFVRASEVDLSITDANLGVGFPLKNSSSDRTFSFAFWLKINSIGVIQYLILKSGGAGNESVLVTLSASNKLTLSISENSTDYTSYAHNSVLTTGIWYHVGITYVGDTYAYRIRIWDDNAQAILGSDKTGTATFIAIGTAPVLLGYPSSSFGLDGNLDEIVIFRDILTISEIDAIRAGYYVSPDRLITPNTFALALTQHAPEVLFPIQTILPTTFALALTQQTPSILFPIQTILPTTFALALTQETSIAFADADVLPSTFALALTQETPTLLFPIQTILPSTLELALTQQTATFLFPIQTIFPSTFALALTLQTPVVAWDSSVLPATFALALTQMTPVIISPFWKHPPYVSDVEWSKPEDASDYELSGFFPESFWSWCFWPACFWPAPPPVWQPAAGASDTVWSKV